MSKRISALGLSAAVLLAVSGCATAPPPGSVFVAGTPPPVVVETIGVATGPEFVWIRGHHHWTGSAYAWEAGRWERRPRPGAQWHDGQWVHHSRGWYWKDGHW